MTHTDLAVVGGGILGLAHAYLAQRMGLRVAVIERNERACGASIRNFGLIWPIGQPAGERHALAMGSRALWLAALRETGLPYAATGSLHLAYHADEAALLREFVDVAGPLGYEVEWLAPSEVLERSSAVRPSGLAGALWSSSEITVDPRRTIRGLSEYLAQQGVVFHYGATAVSVERQRVLTSRGEITAERTVICGGDETSALFPQLFTDAGLLRCKLQMMRTAPQPNGWQLGPALAGGLTLRFYPTFRICSGLRQLEERVARTMPEYDRWGIHVMASQGADGSIAVGDSHEYGEAADCFDKPEIDRLVLQYLDTFASLPDARMVSRWHGTYLKHPDRAWLEAEPLPSVRVVAAAGGAGMTLSFGIAEQVLRSMSVL